MLTFFEFWLLTAGVLVLLILLVAVLGVSYKLYCDVKDRRRKELFEVAKDCEKFGRSIR
jgi:hypothetical protein